ncbi:MAG: hypothetical protein LUF00_12140 [Lachnospiraceae bacterium]|nr:hypothetical protein [Lachnospiraceae bacterium]
MFWIWKVLLGILIVAAIVLVVLYFLGRRMQKKQAVAQEQMEAMKQVVSMLIIDKKMLRLKDSGLPQAAIDQTPKYMRRSKMPIVKAKVGPRIMTLCAERDVWDVLPVKSEVKVELSGIYITAIKSVRGGTIQKPEKKKGIWARVRAKISGKE